MSDAATIDDALEGKLTYLAFKADGAHAHFVFPKKDDVRKSRHLGDKIGHPFCVVIVPIPDNPTEDLAPVTSADSNPMGAVSGSEEVSTLNKALSSDAPPASDACAAQGTPSHIIQLGRLRTDTRYQNYINETEGCARNADIIKNWQLAKFNCKKTLTEIERGSNDDTAAAAHLWKYKMWLSKPKYIGRDHPEHGAA